MFRKVVSRLVIVSLLVTMILPNYVLAAGNSSLADDFAAKTSTQIVKKNKFTQDLMDVCYYPAEQSFYAVGKAGTMLVSTDGSNWSQVTDSALLGSTGLDFVDIYCADDHIAAVGYETSTQQNFIIRRSSGEVNFSKWELTGIPVADHKVQAVAIFDNNIVVTTNTKYYYHSVDGENWTYSELHAASTGASAVAVDSSGNFKVYNNDDNGLQTFAGTIGASWTDSTVDYKLTNVLNLYGSGDDWYLLMTNGSNSSLYKDGLSQDAMYTANTQKQ